MMDRYEVRIKPGPILVMVLFIVFALLASGDTDAQEEYSGEATLSQGSLELTWQISDGVSTWTMSGKTEGWISLGFEPSVAMKDADMAIGWVEEGQPYILDCFSTGETGPHPPDTSLNGTDDLTLIEGSESNGWTTIKFSRMLVTGDTRTDRVIDTDKEITIIWAVGPSDDWRMDHGRGMKRGTFTIDFKTGEVDEDSAPDIWPIHAFLMITSLLLMIDSIFVARFLKTRWKKFLMIHKFAGWIGVIFGILGIFTAFLMISESGRSHLSSPHAFFGLMSLITVISSPILGHLHFKLIRKTRKLRMIHIIVSWVVIGFWVMTIISGLIIAGVL